MRADPIARLRRFNRAVTTEVGALDTSFLGRGRPLGAARLLCAIGPEGRAVSELRDYLGLDSGLLSRLLRGLEAEGLVATDADPADRRRRTARLTSTGAREVARYDRLSDDRAARLLANHPRPEALLAAMDLVASALGQHRVALLRTDPEAPEARYCLEQYYADLAARFDTGFDRQKSLDPEARALRPPLGAFLVAMSDGLPLGCVALKGTGGATGELKRLWVAPSARGLGLARRLIADCEAAARGLGMTRLRLDTNRTLTEAIRLYRATGWVEIPAFNAEPYAHHWFEKPL
jgi:DNA-binding MarR family transcriptional regulator/N-acetylglutamate synthase-like GNAT family acetyltransferase